MRTTTQFTEDCLIPCHWSDRTNATDQSVHHLCQLSSLTSLGVAGARLEDDGLACITKNLTNLSDLNIRGTRVSDKGIGITPRMQ